MKNNLLLLSILVMLLVVACTRNAVTGRNTLSLVPDSQMEEMAVSQYKQFLSENKVVSSSQSKDAEMVQRVGSRIASAVGNFIKAKVLLPRYRIINGNITWYKARRRMHGVCLVVK
jgi:hypothetical protein